MVVLTEEVEDEAAVAEAAGGAVEEEAALRRIDLVAETGHEAAGVGV